MGRRFVALTVCLLLSIGATLTVAQSKGFFDALGQEPLYQIELDSETILSETADGCYEFTGRHSTFVSTHSADTPQGLLFLSCRGLVANKDPINSIKSLRISFFEDAFSSATLFLGNSFLPTENSLELACDNDLEINGNISFFAIQSDGENIIESIEVFYSCAPIYEDVSLPILRIETEENAQIDSRSIYTNCTVTIEDSSNQANNLKPSTAGIRIRGNSTASCPKKPYRLKFDKKQSLFGLTKAKNWCLLADYLDGSSLHNYAALTLANQIRGSSEFTATPHHVNVWINGENAGLYLVTEHNDEKEGRLDMSVESSYILGLFDDTGFFDFSKMPVMLELDESATTDDSEVLGETYFAIDQIDGTRNYWSVKYPEKEDFYLIEGDPSSFQSDLYFSFFEYLQSFLSDMYESFYALSQHPGDQGFYEDVMKYVDEQSLVSFSFMDIFTRELDHQSKSLKIYKRANEDKVSFGPCWDYDSNAFGLKYIGSPVADPFDSFGTYSDVYTSNAMITAFRRSSTGFSLLKDFWTNTITPEIKNDYLHLLAQEAISISSALVHDTALWYDCDYSMVFDNIRYLLQWADRRMTFLNGYYLA